MNITTWVKTGTLALLLGIQACTPEEWAMAAGQHLRDRIPVVYSVGKQKGRLTNRLAVSCFWNRRD